MHLTYHIRERNSRQQQNTISITTANKNFINPRSRWLKLSTDRERNTQSPPRRKSSHEDIVCQSDMPIKSKKIEVNKCQNWQNLQFFYTSSNSSQRSLGFYAHWGIKNQFHFCDVLLAFYCLLPVGIARAIIDREKNPRQSHPLMMPGHSSNVY